MSLTISRIVVYCYVELLFKIILKSAGKTLTDTIKTNLLRNVDFSMLFANLYKQKSLSLILNRKQTIFKKVPSF